MSRAVLVGASILFALVLCEIALRAYYYQTLRPYPLALQELETSVRVFSSGLYGGHLNQVAWRASFTERGHDAPESGPREGYWGSRIAPMDTNCGYLYVCERDQQVDALIDIHGGGFQTIGDSASTGPHLLIIGSSVAFGAYASSMQSTYFAELHRLLAGDHPGLHMSVFGRGASRSSDDLAALVLRGLDLAPDVVLFLNGLNDLYLPSGEGVERDQWHYVRNMEMARRIVAARQIPSVFVLQPFLPTKKVKSELEEEILGRIGPLADPEISVAYKRIATDLEGIATNPSAYFANCAGAFDNEPYTTFSDHWHFADPGHRLLAQCMYESLDLALETAQMPSTNPQ